MRLQFEGPALQAFGGGTGVRVDGKDAEAAQAGRLPEAQEPAAETDHFGL